jgi:hypothetical protein
MDFGLVLGEEGTSDQAKVVRLETGGSGETTKRGKDWRIV